MNITDKTRLIVVNVKSEDNTYPQIIAAMPMSLYEAISEDEWGKWKQGMMKAYSVDTSEHEVIEIVMAYPHRLLQGMFVTKEITPTSMKKTR